MAAEPRLSQRTALELIHLAQHKARISEAGWVVHAERQKILPGIPGLGIREIKLAVGAPPAVLGIALQRQLAAVLESVISLHPGQVGIGRRLLFVDGGYEGRTDSRRIPRSEEHTS